jgi:hypothetical protein
MTETTEFRPEAVADAIGTGIGRRFAGLWLSALGEDGDIIVAAGHVNPARMIRACRAYQRWADGPGWWGAVLPAVIRPWRLRRAVRYANQTRALHRPFRGLPFQSQLQPGKEAVAHVLATTVPGCYYQAGPYDTPDPEDHPRGCNCDGPWIDWGRNTPNATEHLTVVEWY